METVKVKINGSIENFTEWLKEVNEFDDKPFIEIGKNSTDEEIVDMLIDGRATDNDLIYMQLNSKRLQNIANIHYQKISNVES